MDVAVIGGDLRHAYLALLLCDAGLDARAMALEGAARRTPRLYQIDLLDRQLQSGDKTRRAGHTGHADRNKGCF